ncbi:MAG: hypothetical protein L6Q40_02040 [Azonexus sp.]|nr:hypothetical protein [Azonexus sp.]
MIQVWKFLRTVALFFSLGFDDADRLFVDKQDIVGRADVGVPFAHSDPDGGGKIDLVPGLHHPASTTQLRINAVAGLLFGVLVFAHAAQEIIVMEYRPMITDYTGLIRRGKSPPRPCRAPVFAGKTWLSRRRPLNCALCRGALRPFH